MRKIAGSLLMGMALVGVVHDLPAFYPEELDVEVGMGYRRDSLDWSIPGPDNVPDVLSELKWKDLESFCISGRFAWQPCEGLFFRGFGDWAKVQNGSVTDSDFAESGRRDLFSFSESDADCSDMYDFSGGIGYRVLLSGCQIALTPVVGYSLHAQRLNMHCGDLKIFTPAPRLEGPIRGLHSHYHTRWHGPWVGLDLGYDWWCGRFTVNAEYHRAYYHGVGHWNLRNDFLNDFTQTASGHGLVVMTAIQGRYQESWFYGLLFNFMHFRTGSGKDKVELDFRGTSFDFEGGFNGAHWNAFSLVGTLEYQF